MPDLRSTGSPSAASTRTPSDPPERAHEITRLLEELQRGSGEAGERLIPLVYRELHGLAAQYLRRERGDHTLQPTALVNEVYLRLVGQHAVQWQNRAHFFGIAAQIMRRILVDHARRRHAAKRMGGRRVTLDDRAADERAAAAGARAIDLIALDQALGRLAALDARQARVVELRFFGGLDVEQTAEALGIAPATVKRDWTFARAWLQRELSDGG
jgi:RNA polymerase sigma factor (TIGR02999 family)